MTQEEKEFLLKDLCGRLPYGVKFKFKYAESSSEIMRAIYLENYVVINSKDYSCEINDIKPYLFPMSSMTEEQKKEYTHIVNYISSDDTDNWKEGEFIYVEQFEQLMHFYHKNHLDYRGLIEKGLAIDATGLNIY
jgi:Fe-S-cluster containining protein